MCLGQAAYNRTRCLRPQVIIKFITPSPLRLPVWIAVEIVTDEQFYSLGDKDARNEQLAIPFGSGAYRILNLPRNQATVTTSTRKGIPAEECTVPMLIDSAGQQGRIDDVYRRAGFSINHGAFIQTNKSRSSLVA
jgi:hypothetical protein